MAEDIQPDAEMDLPDALRRVAKGLVLDLRALGFRDQPADYAEMLKAETRAVQSLLESDDPRLGERGLQALNAIERERRKVVELELAHAKAGMEALVYHQLSRLRMQGEQQGEGLSSENASAGIAKIMAELAGQEKPDDPAPSSEAEPTDESTP